MKLPRDPLEEIAAQLKRWNDMQIVYVVLFAALVIGTCASCASVRGYRIDPNDTASTIVYGKGMGERTHLKADLSLARWAGVKCTPRQVASAYKALKEGRGSGGSILYYYRCRGPNEYKAHLATIKARWRY